MFMLKRIAFVLLLAIVAVIAAMALKSKEEPFEARWSPPATAPSTTTTFQGPTGAPFIVGPPGPPPGANP
jgi:hypothetical protein